MAVAGKSAGGLLPLACAPKRTRSSGRAPGRTRARRNCHTLPTRRRSLCLPSLCHRRSACSAGRAEPPLGPAADQESAAYFSELLSYSLERLSKEPELLRADQEQLRRSLQDTAVAHHRSFIDAQRCLGDLRAQLQAATGHLDSLARDMPKLQAACDRFRVDAAATATKRADNRQLYSERGGAALQGCIMGRACL